MEIEKVINGQLDRIEKRLEQVATVLLGVPDSGDDGLVGKVNEACESAKNLAEKHDKLNTRFWILVGILVGSGVIGGSIWGALGS